MGFLKNVCRCALCLATKNDPQDNRIVFDRYGSRVCCGAAHAMFYAGQSYMDFPPVCDHCGLVTRIRWAGRREHETYCEKCHDPQ